MLSSKPVTARQAGTRWSAFRRTPGLAVVCSLGLLVEVYTLAFHYTTHVEANGAHQVYLKEFGARIPMTQTFTMRSDGLKGVRIRAATSKRCDITLDWLLFEERQPTSVVPLHGNRKTLRDVSGETWVVMLFPTIAQSIGRTYRLHIRAFDVQCRDRGRGPVQTSDEAALVASLDDVMPGGFLVVGGQERWGDLVFDTIAVGDTILGRFMLTSTAGPDGALRRVWLTGAAIALYNLLLFTFVIHFWPRMRTAPQESESRPFRAVAAGDGRGPVVRYAAVTAGLLAATVAVYASRRGHPAVDLIDEFHTAELRASMGLHQAFSLGDAIIGGETMRAIAAHPNSKITWTVTIPPGARLRTAMATLPAVWSLPGDGVVFRIGVAENGSYSELFAHHLDPARVPAERRWVPIDLDLSRFSGHRVRLVLQTDASLPGRPYDPFNDWARWGAPRIVTD